MPDKPMTLEELIEEFRSAFCESDGRWKQFDGAFQTSSTDGCRTMVNIDVVKSLCERVYSSAILHAAEKARPERDVEKKHNVVCPGCDERQWEYQSHHSVYGFSTCCGKKNVDGGEREIDPCTDRNATIDEYHANLLREAGE